MSCEQYQALIAGGLDNEGPASDPLRIHLSDCESCRAVRREMELDRELIREAFAQPAAPALLSAARRNVIGAIAQRRPPAGGLPWFEWNAAMAMTAAWIVFAVSAGVWWFESRPVELAPTQSAEIEPRVREVVRETTQAEPAEATLVSESEPSKPLREAPARVEVAAVFVSRNPDETERETVMLQVPSDDRDVVIFWLVN